MNAPVVPVQREAVNCNHVNVIHDAVAAEQLHKIGIDGREAAERDLQLGIDPANLTGRRHDHSGEHLPVWIDFEVPVRKVVRLIPQHHRFDHAFSFVNPVFAKITDLQRALQFVVQNVPVPLNYVSRSADPSLGFRMSFDLQA